MITEIILCLRHLGKNTVLGLLFYLLKYLVKFDYDVSHCFSIGKNLYCKIYKFGFINMSVVVLVADLKHI